MNVPGYALLPSRTGFVANALPDRRGPVLLAFMPQGTGIDAVETKIAVVRYSRSERVNCRERRRGAREGTRGRRGAASVPLGRRWDVDIAAHPSVPQHEVQRFVEATALETKVWRRRP